MTVQLELTDGDAQLLIRVLRGYPSRQTQPSLLRERMAARIKSLLSMKHLDLP